MTKRVVLFGRGSTFFKTAREYIAGYDGGSIELAVSEPVSDLTDAVVQNNIDAIVSPGNSFGFLNGGFDKVIADFYGKLSLKTPDQVSKDFQHELFEQVGGYNPPGSAIVVDMNNLLNVSSTKLPKLVHVSTMSMPEKVDAKDPVIFNCLWNLFTCVKKDEDISNVLLTGLGTGTGGVSLTSFLTQLLKVASTHGYIQDITWKDAKDVDKSIKDAIQGRS